MALYPPLVNSSLPAFTADTEEIKFYFDFPNTMSSKEKEEVYIQYTIVNQRNNYSVLAEKEIESTSQLQISENGKHYFIINNSKIQNGWVPGTIYKVQIRFAQLRKNPSEWSTICYLKATGNSDDIEVSILNMDNNSSAVYVDSPKFYGVYKPAESDESEVQRKYRFELLDFNSNSLIEDTGWKSHIEGSLDEVVFSQLLINGKRYYLRYSIETKNGYLKTIENDFVCIFDLFKPLDIQFANVTNNYEDGYIDLNLSSAKKVSTNLLLRRTDSKSNFQIWEDYKIFNVWDEQVNINFKDFLVEHGIEYKYSIQQLSQEGHRGQAIYSNTVQANYEHMFLVGNDKQLKIKFNPKISSWKRTLQESKVDTIGSQYPFIVRNGNVNYFTFPISGLISYHSDEEELFCSKNSLCMGNQITADIEGQLNLDDINIVLEREFRNQVEEFLTNGDYKYFKSPTEGTKLIALTGVSLSPEEALGRMIYSFNSTAYEVNKNQLSNIMQLNVIDSGDYLNVNDMGEKSISSILSKRISNSSEDLFVTIKNKLEGAVENTNYIRKLRYLQDVKIEVLTNSDCIISIQQSPGGAWESIIISKNINFYSIPNIVKIYGLKCETVNTNLNIQYNAVCYYEEIEEDNNMADKIDNLNVISKFMQVYTPFTFAAKNMNIFEALKQKDRLLLDIYSLSYLSIEAPMGTQVEVNGEIFTIDDSGYKEFNNIVITSAIFKTETSASVSVVLNGVTQK